MLQIEKIVSNKGNGDIIKEIICKLENTFSDNIPEFQLTMLMKISPN